MDALKIAENVSNRYIRAEKEKFRVLGQYQAGRGNYIDGPARPTIEEAFKAFQDRLLKIQATKGHIMVTQFVFAREVPKEIAPEATSTFGYESFHDPVLWDKCYQELIQNELAGTSYQPNGR